MQSKPQDQHSGGLENPGLPGTPPGVLPHRESFGPFWSLQHPMSIRTVCRIHHRTPVNTLQLPDGGLDFRNFRILLMMKATYDVSCLSLQLTWLFDNDGIPANWRQMNGFSVNTLKLINASGEEHLCKFHCLPKGGKCADTPSVGNRHRLTMLNTKSTLCLLFLIHFCP